MNLNFIFIFCNPHETGTRKRIIKKNVIFKDDKMNRIKKKLLFGRSNKLQKNENFSHNFIRWLGDFMSFKMESKHDINIFFAFFLFVHLLKNLSIKLFSRFSQNHANFHNFYSFPSIIFHPLFTFQYTFQFMMIFKVFYCDFFKVFVFF